MTWAECLLLITQGFLSNHSATVGLMCVLGQNTIIRTSAHVEFVL